jgi:hypothetical protein
MVLCGQLWILNVTDQRAPLPSSWDNSVNPGFLQEALLIDTP